MEKVTLRNMFELSTLSELGEDDIELLMSEIGDKVDNYILVNDSFEREIERLKSIKKIIENKIKTVTNVQTRFKDRLKINMIDFDKQNIKGDLGTVYLRKNDSTLFLDKSKFKNEEELAKYIIENYNNDYGKQFADVEFVEKYSLKKDKLLEEYKLDKIKIKGVDLIEQEPSLVIPKLKQDVIK